MPPLQERLRVYRISDALRDAKVSVQPWPERLLSAQILVHNCTTEEKRSEELASYITLAEESRKVYRELFRLCQTAECWHRVLKGPDYKTDTDMLRSLWEDKEYVLKVVKRSADNCMRFDRENSIDWDDVIHSSSKTRYEVLQEESQKSEWFKGYAKDMTEEARQVEEYALACPAV